MQKYVFLSNTLNPKSSFTELYHHYSYEASFNFNLRREEWRQHLNWINSNVVGRPKSTPFYTVEELEKQNMIGVYCPIEKYTWRTPDEGDIVEF